MSLSKTILCIGFDKNGEADYALSVGYLVGLDYEQMTRMRTMVCVAIGQMEQTWYQEQMLKPENMACQAPDKDAPCPPSQ